MSKKRKAPADAPSTLIDAAYAKRKREAKRIEEEAWAKLNGPVTVSKKPTTVTFEIVDRPPFARCESTRVPGGKVRCEKPVTPMHSDHGGRDARGHWHFWMR